VRIAYVVSAYKLPDQLVRLIRRLHTETSSFVVHVDRKTDHAVFERMVSGTRELGCVEFVDRHVCHWGGFGHVRATLKGLERLYADGRAFDYVVLLTGQDYPLRSAAEIERRLAGSGERSFMSYWPVPREAWSGRGGLDRIERWHAVWRHHLHVWMPFVQRRLPAGLTPWGGPPYWCLAKPVTDYVWEWVQANPETVRFFEHVWIPDEVFFQTIILNSPLRDTVVNDDLRHIDWTRLPAPSVFRREHFDELIDSGKLFARKFDETVDAEILELLDRYIDGAA
jgi:hypothetical protein